MTSQDEAPDEAVQISVILTDRSPPARGGEATLPGDHRKLDTAPRRTRANAQLPPTTADNRRNAALPSELRGKPLTYPS